MKNQTKKSRSRILCGLNASVTDCLARVRCAPVGANCLYSAMWPLVSKRSSTELPRLFQVSHHHFWNDDNENDVFKKYNFHLEIEKGNDGKTIIPEVASIKPPGREDLIYSEESPDFCNPDRVTGSLGTAGRVCNSTSPGVEGCELLCCGRGYETRTTKTRVNCHCRFKWCCEVTCKICTVKKHVNTCRWYIIADSKKWNYLNIVTK